LSSALGHSAPQKGILVIRSSLQLRQLGPRNGAWRLELQPLSQRYGRPQVGKGTREEARPSLYHTLQPGCSYHCSFPGLTVPLHFLWTALFLQHHQEFLFASHVTFIHLSQLPWDTKNILIIERAKSVSKAFPAPRSAPL
jgi:hypothetical protein